MNGKIVILGLGPGDHRFLSSEAVEVLFSEKPLYLRTEIHPTVDFLKASGLEYSSFDCLYEEKNSFEEVYNEIVKALIQKAKEKGEIVYAVPGHPWVGERTVSELICVAEKNGLIVRIVNGMSFLDLLLSAVRYDPGGGLTIMDAHRIEDHDDYSPKNAAVIMQVNNRFLASRVKLALLEKLPADFEISVVKALGTSGQDVIQKLPLHELDHSDEFDHLTTIFVPSYSGYIPKNPSNNIAKLTDIMIKLRSHNGCPWDREQTHQSLKPFLIEEAYEVAEAIDSESIGSVCEELGDVLLQIVFHAQIGKENGEFELDDVIDGICEKMIRRHPHVFAGYTEIDTEEVLKNWDEIKRNEKTQVKKSLLDGIPKDFPALMKAYKMQNKAAKVGFDWENIQDATKKIFEETDELMEALKSKNEDNAAEEVGDLLFAVVNVARFASVEPETALLKATDKFYRRFRYIEKIAEERGLSLEAMSLDEMDGLWEEAKHLEDER